MTDWEEPIQTQGDLFEAGQVRGVLDALLAESRLYRQSADYLALLDFVARLRNFAPFNAMLLHVQKPGLTFAASAKDWYDRFGRRAKQGARPLLILLPFGPVGLVYDVLDTEGRDLPRDVAAFFAAGPVDGAKISRFRERCARANIVWEDVDAGDAAAGSIRCTKRGKAKGVQNTYRVCINRNHSPAVQLSTLAHELAHLFLGHLGDDEAFRIMDRRRTDHATGELEAESTAFVVCSRNDITVNSEKYLASYVRADTTTDALDIYRVMWAAGQVEKLLGVGARLNV